MGCYLGCHGVSPKLVMVAWTTPWTNWDRMSLLTDALKNRGICGPIVDHLITPIFGQVSSSHEAGGQRLEHNVKARAACRQKGCEAASQGPLDGGEPYMLNTYSTYSKRPPKGLYSARIRSIPDVFHTYS
jgi:hypothetical protein